MVLPVVVKDDALLVVIASTVLDVGDIINPFFSFLEALSEDDDNDDEAGAPDAPSCRGGQAEPFWSSMFCW